MVLDSDRSEEDGNTYIIASPGLLGRPELIKKLLTSAYNVEDDPPLSLVDPGSDESTSMKTKSVHTPVGYILLVNLSQEFWWSGSLMSVAMGTSCNFHIKRNRLRLVAESQIKRLEIAKQQFASLLSGSDAEDKKNNPHLLVPHQSHLPVVNRQLRRIGQMTYQFTNNIVSSVETIQQVAQKYSHTQPLIASWFSFASAHCAAAVRLMDFTTYSHFKPLTTKLAIQWVSFICNDCVPTDPQTFKLAVSALEFAHLQTSNQNILYISDDDFAQLRTNVAKCMTLLMSHFDIMGAKSGLEESKRRKARMETLESQPMTSEGTVSDLGYGVLKDKRVQLVRENWVRKIQAIENNRLQIEREQQLVGRPLDAGRIEDRGLYQLASEAQQFSIRWQKLEFIGAGTFGSVYRAVNLDTGGQMAVKELRVQDAGAGNHSNLYKAIRDEMRVMQMLKHVNIVEYYGIEVHRDRVYIFEEYCSGGSLSSVLEHGKIDDEIVQLYAVQLLEGLIYLHSQNIVHRDIKPDSEQVFLEARYNLIIFRHLIGPTRRTHQICRLWSSKNGGPK